MNINDNNLCSKELNSFTFKSFFQLFSGVGARYAHNLPFERVSLLHGCHFCTNRHFVQLVLTLNL